MLIPALIAHVLAAAAAAVTAISTPSGARPAPPVHVPPVVAEPNDNRRPAGRLERGVLTIQLEARAAAWYPETQRGPGLPVFVFAENGKQPTAPGPLIRVPAGTRIRATVRNSLEKPMLLRGLHDRAGVQDSVDIAPGATQEIDFTASVPGTYFYYGRTEGDRQRIGFREDAVLHGAFIVDSAGAVPPPDERVMMISLWLGKQTLDTTIAPRNMEAITVNGLSWPHTERLSYTVGDSVHWRVINASVAPHPMHLHGFYYRVDARGTAMADTTYSLLQRKQVVTEYMAAGTTMRMAWAPTRAGNWLFHCHLIAHVSIEEVRLGNAPQVVHGEHGGAANAHNHALTGMAGLVMGLNVRPQPGVALARTPVARRRMRAFVNERPNVFGDQPGYGMIVQEGKLEPARDSLTFPGAALVLQRGEPTEITVHNRTHQPVTIHWHGIELESFYDGVGDWSGWGNRTAPAIAPGDSFVVRLTPDRAGTFIYHTHNEEGAQLASGLYGSLLILPPGAQRDTTTDRVFLLGAGGPNPVAPPFVNGTATPAPVELHAGSTYRLRLINISPSDIKRVRLLGDGADSAVVQQWRAFAKDGAELPAHQATMRPAVVTIGPGETYDYELTRETPVTLSLEIRTAPRGPISFARLPVRVR